MKLGKPSAPPASRKHLNKTTRCQRCSSFWSWWTYWLLSAPSPLRLLALLAPQGWRCRPPSRPAVESRCASCGAGTAGSWRHRHPPLPPWLPRKLQFAGGSPTCTPRSLCGGRKRMTTGWRKKSRLRKRRTNTPRLGFEPATQNQF